MYVQTTGTIIDGGVCSLKSFNLDVVVSSGTVGGNGMTLQITMAMSARMIICPAVSVQEARRQQ